MQKAELKYDPIIPHIEGAPWSLVRFNLMMHRRVIIPISTQYHYYFNENLLGYLFVQEDPQKLRQYFDENSIPCVCIFDTITREFAIMADNTVVRLKMAMADPSTVLSIMPHPIGYYAVGHDELICVNGPFPGAHGYVVRINRDRKFIFKLDNGLTFGTSIINDLKFLTPEEYARLPKSERF